MTNGYANQESYLDDTLTSNLYYSDNVLNTDSTRLTLISNFLINPYDSNISTSADLYNYAASALNIVYNSIGINKGFILTASLPNGVVWYYNDGTNSTSNNTYTNFLNNSIYSNQNTNSANLDALLSNDGNSFYVTKTNNISSNNIWLSTFVLRLGASKKTPLGCISLANTY